MAQIDLIRPKKIIKLNTSTRQLNVDPPNYNIFTYFNQNHMAFI